jgi:glycosyltransferase involved in cell wall biosynthesis
MKILLAIHHFPPRYTGGAELRALRTAQAMQDLGYEIQVVCVEAIDVGSTNGVVVQKQEYEGVMVHRISFDLSATPSPFLFEYDNQWIGDYLRKFCQDWKPDGLHLFSGYLMSGRVLLVAEELKIPAILSLTDYWFLCRKINKLTVDGEICPIINTPADCVNCYLREKRRYQLFHRYWPKGLAYYCAKQKKLIKAFQSRKKFLHHAFEQVSIAISPSEFVRSSLIDSGFAASQIIHSRQGCVACPEPFSKSPKQSSGQLKIGYIGQLAYHKGVHVLYEAVKLLPNAPIEVQLYGNLEKFPDYVKELQGLGKKDQRLKLMGNFPREQLSKIMEQLDIVVVPSIWYENSPNTILEAFAHQVPVIASDLGGMSELIRPEVNGLLFAPGDAADLARKIQKLLDTPEVLLSMTTGISPVRTFSQEIDHLEEIYQQVLSKPKA